MTLVGTKNMSVVDSSGRLEYLADAPNAGSITNYLLPTV